MNRGGWMAWILGLNTAGFSAQMETIDTWMAGDVLWCGNPEHWTWHWGNDSIPVHRLHASGEGTHILWGCLASDGVDAENQPWVSSVFWSQALSGSNSNRSRLLWATPPLSQPELSSIQLVEDHIAGLLDNTGGVAAGQNGSDDPLICHAPNMPAWAVEPSCHQWGQPFAYQGTWSWNQDSIWKVESHDERRHSQTWVDTLVEFGAQQRPCIGIAVSNTSSNTSQWEFGWAPTPINEPLPAPENHVDLLDSITLQALLWPNLDGPVDLLVRQPCLSSAPASASLIPLATQCDNQWEWTLPCALQLDQPLDVQCQGSLHQLWLDGTQELESGDLAFSEIMADPTPSIHAPATTYLEVVNLSAFAIQPERLKLIDSGVSHELVWTVTPSHQKLVPPMRRFLIVDEDQPWIDAGLEGVLVLRAIGWSGLRDEGESLSIIHENDTLETLIYFEEWWKGEVQDGRALSIVGLNQCDHPNSWHPDPNGASPGAPSSIEAQAENTSASTLVLTLTPAHELTIASSVEWHILSTPTLTIGWGDTTSHHQAVMEWSEFGSPVWKTNWPQANARVVEISIDQARSCSGFQPLSTIDTTWEAFRPPRPSDIQLTEVLPMAHPVLGAEFVEWTNISTDTLSWNGRLWAPFTCFIQSSKSRSQFAHWMGAEWFADSSNVIWQVDPGMSLSNNKGTLELRDAWNHRLTEEQYDFCGHSDLRCSKEGRSMERIPLFLSPNESLTSPGHLTWRSCPHEKGMSPGMASAWQIDTVISTQKIGLGVLEDRWMTTVPVGEPLALWASQHWTPATNWRFEWQQGMLVAIANWGPDSSSIGPTHALEERLNFPRLPWEETGIHDGLVKWNEVLPTPTPGFGTFIEIVTEANLWMNGWAWSNDAWSSPSDYDSVSDVAWWVPEETETCFATCPNWVENAPSNCWAANVPSLHGNRELTIQTPSTSDVFRLDRNLHSPWLIDEEGYSLARIPESNQWTTTPPPARSTPGNQNGPATLQETADQDALQCTPSTIQPSGHQGWDVVEFRWEPPNLTDVFALEFVISDISKLSLLNQHFEHWSGEPATWNWRGEDHNGALQPPGPYLGTLNWENLSNHSRGRERCMVAISPN